MERQFYGVAGNLEPDKPDQNKTVTPSTVQQVVVADTGYELAQVTVNAVTSSIDNNIVAGNIKKDVSILGVTGNYDPQPNLQSKDVTINQNGTTTITADTGYDGLSDVDVTVSGILDTSDANATANNIEFGKTAYVNGVKLTGTLTTTAGYNPNISSSQISLADNKVTFTTRGPDKSIVNRDTQINASADQSVVANKIGATAEKIKKDEVILGVTGTYEGTKAVLPDGIRFGISVSNATDFSWLANVDTSNITNASAMFQGIPMTSAYLFDTSNVINAEDMFSSCSSLQSIPLYDFSNVTSIKGICWSCTNLQSVPLWNTSNVENMNQAFQKCSNLTNFPVLNTSKVKRFSWTFNSCNNLSNESLNNILAMCIGATSYTGTKTLSFIGLSQTQAETCQTLSNWDAFVTAGWSTGY